jgi:hypothetical protein
MKNIKVHFKRYGFDNDLEIREIENYYVEYYYHHGNNAYYLKVTEYIDSVAKDILNLMYHNYESFDYKKIEEDINKVLTGMQIELENYIEPYISE